jgi:hypothetical protein
MLLGQPPEEKDKLSESSIPESTVPTVPCLATSLEPGEIPITEIPAPMTLKVTDLTLLDPLSELPTESESLQVPDGLLAEVLTTKDQEPTLLLSSVDNG